jgi:hypothetical protein
MSFNIEQSVNTILNDKVYFLATIILVLVLFAWYIMRKVRHQVNYILNKKLGNRTGLERMANVPSEINNYSNSEFNDLNPIGQPNVVMTKYTTTQNVPYVQPTSPTVYEVHDSNDYINPAGTGRIYDSPESYQQAFDQIKRPHRPSGSSGFAEPRNQYDDTPYHDMVAPAQLDKTKGPYNTPLEANNLMKNCIHGVYKQTGCYECSVQACQGNADAQGQCSN